MRAPDRELLAVATELREAIAAGRKPRLNAAEWDALTSYIETRGKRRRGRGQHQSMARHIQSVHRRMLRNQMELLRADMRYDPAELEHKRSMRANGEIYDLDRRVAQAMRERLLDWKPVPTVATLENILRTCSLCFVRQ
jgi:hypothetical protein